MRITGFKVDKDQPINTMKVGNNWRFDNDRVENNVKPVDYYWDHSEWKSPLPRPRWGFNVIKINGELTDTMKVAFWVQKSADETLGEFSIEPLYGTGDAEVTTQPVFEDDASKGKPGLITFTPADETDSEFVLKYKADGEEEASEVYRIRQMTAKDYLHCPTVGEYIRKNGAWVQSK